MDLMNGLGAIGGGMMSPSYLLYIVIISLIPLFAQMKVKSAYTKYSQIRSSNGLTGAQVARQVLDANGLQHIGVESVAGTLTDHYDPQAKVVRLSEANYQTPSLAATAVAAHECGHAIQDKESYAFLRFRHALVPLANLGSKLSWVLIIAGFIFTITGLFFAGIIFMAVVVLFQVVTLPVEFNASSRAMQQVVSLGIIRNDEESETKKVLSAAALTYVAAAAVAVIELVRLIMIFNSRRE